MFDEGSLVGGIAEVNCRFTIDWIDDPELDGASIQQVTERYGSFVAEKEAALMPEICLLVNEASLQSFFDS
jgi:hypothetical protein